MRRADLRARVRPAVAAVSLVLLVIAMAATHPAAGAPPSPAPAAPKPLGDPSTGPGSDPMLIRRGEFELDPRIIDALKHGKSDELVPLRPFEDVAIPFTAATSVPLVPTYLVWRATVTDDPLATMSVMVHQPRGGDPDFRRIVIGIRSRRHGDFEIRAQPHSTKLEVEQVDYARRPPCGVAGTMSLTQRDRNRCRTLVPPLDASPMVNVLVVYTHLLSGTPAQDVILKDDLAYALLVVAQDAMTNSGASILLELSGGEAQMVTDPLNESGTMRSICEAMKSTATSRFASVRTLRTAQAADLVCLIVKKERDRLGKVGWGYIPPCLLEGEMLAADHAFSVCSRSHLGDSLAHELGHNFGCHHDCRTGCQAEVPYYRHGNEFPWPGPIFGTVMSERGYRVALFSTPDPSFGYPPGAPQYTTGDALYRNNARILRETAGIIAAYR